MLQIDAKYAFTLAAGEPFLFEVQFKDTQNNVLDLTDREFVLSFYRQNRTAEQRIEGVARTDLAGPRFEFVRDGTFSELLYPNRTGTIELAERLRNGKAVIFQGKYTITESAPDVPSLDNAVLGRRGVRFVLSESVRGFEVAQSQYDYVPSNIAPEPDTTPNAFTIAPVTGATRNTATDSAAFTISGIDAPASWTVDGGTAQVADGAFASSGTVTNGQAMRVRLNSSASYSTVATATLTVGGVSADFSVTTAAAPVVTPTPAPSLSLSSPVTVTEGNSGTTAFTWTLTLNRDGSTAAYPYSWAVAGSGANPADAADFGGTYPGGSGTFAAGETVKTITVLASGDTAVEPNETFTMTVTATGLNTVTSTGTISNDDSAPVDPGNGATGVYRFASPASRFPNAQGFPSTSQAAPYHSLIYNTHILGSGDANDIAGIFNAVYIEQGTCRPLGNGFKILELYIEALDWGVTVPVTFPGRPYPVNIADNEADVRHDGVTPQMFGAQYTVFPRGFKWRYRGVAEFPAGQAKLPGNLVEDDWQNFGFCYDPTVRTPTNLSGTGSITWGGSSPGSSITMTNSSQIMPIAVAKFVSGDPDTYLVIGDSIFMGSSAGSPAPNGGIGIPAKFLFTATPALTARGGCNAAITGGVGGTWTSGGGGTGLNPSLATLVKYANNTIDDYGTNNFAAGLNLSGSAQNSAQGQVYSPWPYLRSGASTAPGTKPMKIWRTKLWPRTAGGITTNFPEDQTPWGVSQTVPVSEVWEAGGSVDKFNAWLDTQLANGAIDGLIDFGPIVRADPYGDPATSVLYHRWATALLMVADGTHPNGPGSTAMAQYMDDRITALQGGTIRPKFSLVGSSRKLEGGAGATTTYTFMVTRNTTGGAASIDWAVTPFSGTTVNANDFAGGVVPSGTLTIPDGSSHATFDVVVKGDSNAEGSEQFDVVISNPTGGYGIYFATARGQITNDDGDPPLWTPDQLGAKLVDYFLPASLSGQSTVATWTGAKGVLSYAQADTTKQPAFASTSYGNKGGVTFDGTDDYLDMGGVSGLPSGAAHFGMFASEFENNTARMVFFSHGGGTSTTTRVFGKNSGTGVPYVDQGAVSALGTATWNNKLIAFVLECSVQPASVASLWANGADALTATLPSNQIAANGTARLGAAIPGITAWAPWKGSIGHHGFLNAPLTENERQRLEGWMSWNNGQNGANLPSSHPFKTVAPVIEAA